jgi:hypothetical protein
MKKKKKTIMSDDFLLPLLFYSEPVSRVLNFYKQVFFNIYREGGPLLNPFPPSPPVCIYVTGTHSTGTALELVPCDMLTKNAGFTFSCS